MAKLENYQIVKVYQMLRSEDKELNKLAQRIIEDWKTNNMFCYQVNCSPSNCWGSYVIDIQYEMIDRLKRMDIYTESSGSWECERFDNAYIKQFIELFGKRE